MKNDLKFIITKQLVIINVQETVKEYKERISRTQNQKSSWILDGDADKDQHYRWIMNHRIDDSRGVTISKKRRRSYNLFWDEWDCDSGVWMLDTFN